MLLLLLLILLFLLSPLQVSQKKFSLHVTPRFKDAISKGEEKQWRELSSFVTEVEWT